MRYFLQGLAKSRGPDMRRHESRELGIAAAEREREREAIGDKLKET